MRITDCGDPKNLYFGEKESALGCYGRERSSRGVESAVFRGDMACCRSASPTAVLISRHVVFTVFRTKPLVFDTNHSF